MRKLTCLTLGLVLSVAFGTYAHAEEGEDSAKQMQATVNEETASVVRFVSSFLEKVKEDETFREACTLNLGNCLSDAEMEPPAGFGMSYSHDADTGHSVQYPSALGGTITVSVDSQGNLDIDDSSSFDARGSCVGDARQWFVYKCYSPNISGPFLENACWRGDDYCFCGGENKYQYPCYAGCMNEMLACNSQ